jgi:hypothetical protein
MMSASGLAPSVRTVLTNGYHVDLWTGLLWDTLRVWRPSASRSGGTIVLYHRRIWRGWDGDVNGDLAAAEWVERIERYGDRVVSKQSVRWLNGRR